MTQIGASFDGSKTDKNGNTYFIISLNKDITPIILDDKKLLCFKMNPRSKDNEKAPKWILDSFVPTKKEEQEKKEETKSEENADFDEEVPF